MMTLSLSLASHQVLPLRLPKLSQIFLCLLVPQFAFIMGIRRITLVSLPRVKATATASRLSKPQPAQVPPPLKPSHHHPFQDKAQIPYAGLLAPSWPAPPPPLPILSHTHCRHLLPQWTVCSSLKAPQPLTTPGFHTRPPFWVQHSPHSLSLLTPSHHAGFS